MPKRGKTLNSQCREFVIKLQDYFERESQNGGPLLHVTQVQERLSEALGISAKTIYNINKEKFGASGSEENILRTPKKRRRQKSVTGVDSFDADAIRNHVYNYYTRNEYPTTAMNGLLAFASKNTSDYHEEMDAETFKSWFQNQLLPSLPEPSIIIIDNASYHSAQINKAPTQAHKKADLAGWLEKNGIETNPEMLKSDLLKLVFENKEAKKLYVIDELALAHGHRVLRIPPYHCQYNAIELIWAQVKGYAARHNTTPPFSTKKMLNLLKEACSKVTKEDWVKVVEKTRKLILEDYQRDIRVDSIIDNEIVIRVTDGDSDSISESESE